MMKMKHWSFLAGALVLAQCLAAQVYPLSENNWSNPQFVQRFLGSYGVLTDKEPQITTAESDVFKNLGNLLRNNDSQGAIRSVQNAIKPDSSAALDYTLGNLLLQSGDYAGGVRAYEAAIQKFPNFLRAYKNAGLAYIQMQNFEKGSEFIVKSIELGNQEGDSFGLLGYCYLNMGLTVAALDAYRMAGVLAPNNRDWQVGKATALQRLGVHEEAIAKFDELIRSQPGNRSFYVAAANSALSLRDETRAARYLEVLRRNSLADAQALMLLGDIYLNQNLFSLARQTYADVIAQSGSQDVSRVLRFVRGLVGMGAHQEANSFMRQLESSSMGLTSEQRTQFLNLKSQLALAMGDSEQAVASLEEVIAGDPLNGEALMLLGGFYFDSQDFERALFYYERAQKITAHQLNGFVQAARVKVAQRQFAEAVSLLQQAQSIRHQSHVEDYLNAVRNALRASS
jgi:tetratricopeptide (TPR) repeat protein